MAQSTFYANAESFLQTNAQSLLDKFLSEPQQGTWHPNGFAVFQLGEVPDLGQVRFHVWPRHQRVTLKGQPAIHSHPWELCSLVIAGCYRDTLYQAIRFDVDGPGRLQGFTLQFGTKNEGDCALPAPVWYEVTAVEERTVTKGRFHQLPAGALHASEIPLDAFAATLVITSRQVDMNKLLLIGSRAFPATRYIRPAVSIEEFDYIKDALLSALRTQH